MASSKVSDTPNPLASCSVTLPMRTMTDGAMKGPSESNSSSGYMSCLRADIPEIPDIPSSLLRPPASERQTNTFASKPSAILPLSSAFAASSDLVIQSDQSADAESSKTPENLDSLIRNQVGRQVDRVFADAVKDFQEHLVSKANEVDKLRVDLQNMEHKEMDMFSGILQKNGIPPQSTFSRTHSSTSTGASASRAGGLGTSTSGYSIPGFESIGLRETNAQMDDLKRKLKMTTELCAKQDAYYRDIVNDLEKRLKESIAGRDHVLALRESEASGQLKLIQQLEAGLRKQQQIIDSKDESLNSMQASVRQLEENLAAHKSFLDKIRRIASEEDKKRFRSGLVSSALENTASVGQIGDALVELIQKSLFDDDKDKKTLKSSLERVEAEFKRSKELSETKLEELQSANKTRISKLEDEHDQALQLTANRAALVRKELENLQQETAKLKEEHQTVVSAMEGSTKCLEIELEKARKTSYETKVSSDAKCRELECLVRDLKADLQNAKDKQESLYSRLSQEQATVLTLNEKVHNTEKLSQEAEEKREDLSKELTNLREKYNEEAHTLRENIAEREKLIREIREETTRLRESEVEKAVNEEREKSNARLDGLLDQLTKSNQSVATLKEDLLSKEIELSKRLDENGKLRGDLELRTKEMNLIREEKITLHGEQERCQSEVSNLGKQIAKLSNSVDLKSKSLEEAQILVQKLQTQLAERESVLTSFKAQGTNLAEIIERNSQTGDSLQRERQQLIRTLEERIVEVEEMKSHREILAKKLKSKDKRVKELEEETSSVTNSLKIKQEELDALMEDRSNIIAELKLRQLEVSKLKDENSSLSSLVEGKDGEREKEITKLLSRLKGSEQDLALTRKLLKTKGVMSGKAVRVAESMQQEVTAKRGELDALQNKIHWLTESLNTASKDARYYERRSSELSEKLNQLTVDREQLELEFRKTREQCDDLKKKLSHMEQALEKAALKHADSQGVIEKMEQEMARLKLKHSLEIKELERTSKAFPLRAEAASLIEFLTKVNTGFRWPPLTTQANYRSAVMAPKQLPTLLAPAQLQQSELVALDTEPQAVTSQSREKPDTLSRKNAEVTEDLKSLLLEVRSLISSFQAHVSQITTPMTTPGPKLAAQGTPAPEKGPPENDPSYPNEPELEKGQAVQPFHNMSPKRGVCRIPSETKKRNKEQAEERYQLRKRKERSPPIPDVGDESDMKADTGSDSSLTTDLNSRLSNNELVDTDDLFELPLHSSSPRRESMTGSEYSRSRDRVHSPLSLSVDSDGSDVTSLLIDESTSTGSTFITNELLNAPLSSKFGSASSLVSGSQWSSIKRLDAAPMTTKHSPSVPQRKQKQFELKGTFDAREWRPHRNHEITRKTKGSLTKRKTSSETEPVYKRAETILQSLAQTGARLTTKNREIEHLLKEQDKKIRKCRKNEHNIHALLS